MLEDLPNEIILDIFSFLEVNDLARAFSLLNTRFECLLYNSGTPLYARLTSKSTIQLDKFVLRIKHLSLIDLLPNDVLLLFQQCNLPQLTNLTISSTNSLYFGQVIDHLIYQILSLTNLSKCEIKFSPTLYILKNHLPYSSSIRHLSLSMITLDMLFDLLIHLPKLCSLNVWLNSNGRKYNNQTLKRFYSPFNLRKLILILHNDITFQELFFLLFRVPVLRSLEVSGSVWDHEYLNSNHWKNILLGEHSFPVLNKIIVNIYVRHTTRVPPMDLISSQFNEDIFHRTNFSVIFDQMFWFYLKCAWNN